MDRRDLLQISIGSIVLLSGCSDLTEEPSVTAVREFYVASDNGNIEKTRRLTVNNVESDNELTDISVEKVEVRTFDNFYSNYNYPQDYNTTLKNFRSRGQEYGDWEMVYYAIVYGETEYEGYWQTVKTEDGWKLLTHYQLDK